MMYGRPPPMIPKLKSDIKAEVTARHICDSFSAIVYIEKVLWPHLKARYEAAPLPPPNNYLHATGYS